MDLDLTIIILIISVALLGVQLAALLHIYNLLKYLKIVFKELGISLKPTQKSGKSQGIRLRKCRYCKYRRTYINAAVTEDNEDFYYRCQLNNQPVMLDHSCDKFEFEF